MNLLFFNPGPLRPGADETQAPPAVRVAQRCRRVAALIDVLATAVLAASAVALIYGLGAIAGPAQGLFLHAAVAGLCLTVCGYLVARLLDLLGLVLRRQAPAPAASLDLLPPPAPEHRSR